MESIYKIDAGSDHVAKFRGDRPRELGDYALKKKEKHHEHFIRPPVTPYGRPNNINVSFATTSSTVPLFNHVSARQSVGKTVPNGSIPV